jgi:hypothetical protein
VQETQEENFGYKRMSIEKILRTIIVSTGRSGTLSCANMVEQLFRSCGRRVEHEYRSREFQHSFCELQETGAASHVTELQEW